MFAKTLIGFQTSLGGLPEPFCKTPLFINYIDPTPPPKWFHFLWKLFKCVFFWWKKCLLGFPAREKCLNWSPIVSNKNIPKNPEQFPKNPGIKIWRKSRPGKSRDPGILQKSRPVPEWNSLERWTLLRRGRGSLLVCEFCYNMWIHVP